MNAKKFFGENAKRMTADEFEEFAKREFKKLEEAVFSVMPEGCFLKMWKVLDLLMVFMLSSEMVKRRLVSRKDICSLCSAKDCPFNKVSLKGIRVLKVKAIGSVYNQ